MRCLTLLASLLLFAPQLIVGQTAIAQENIEAQGGQFERLGDWEVHYSAFASTFLLPEVAQAYNLVRSRAQGVISLSVLDPDTKKPQRVAITGYALNTLGQRRELNFRRITEGDALYYLASIQHGDDERYRFFITLQLGDKIGELRFSQVFYRR